LSIKNYDIDCLIITTDDFYALKNRYPLDKVISSLTGLPLSLSVNSGIISMECPFERDSPGVMILAKSPWSNNDFPDYFKCSKCSAHGDVTQFMQYWMTTKENSPCDKRTAAVILDMRFGNGSYFNRDAPEQLNIGELNEEEVDSHEEAVEAYKNEEEKTDKNEDEGICRLTLNIDKELSSRLRIHARRRGRIFSFWASESLKNTMEREQSEGKK
jgi:hypothetical protein